MARLPFDQRYMLSPRTDEYRPTATARATSTHLVRRALRPAILTRIVRRLKIMRPSRGSTLNRLATVQNLRRLPRLAEGLDMVMVKTKIFADHPQGIA